MSHTRLVKKYSKIFILVLFLSFVAYEVYKSLNETPSETKPNTVFNSKILQAQDVQIHAGAQIVKLKKQDKDWKIIEPIKDDANSEFINSWLEKLLDSKSESLPNDANLNWAKYGLNDPFAKIEISGPEGLKFSIEVSAAKSFDDQFYLRVKNSQSSEPQLVISNMTWLEIILKKPLEFISLTKSLDYDPSTVNQVEIRGVGVYTKKDKLWVFQDQNNLDPAKINHLIEKIKALSIQGYESQQIFKSTPKPLKSIYELTLRFDDQSRRHLVIYDLMKPCRPESQDQCQLVSWSSSSYPFWAKEQDLKPITTNSLIK